MKWKKKNRTNVKMYLLDISVCKTNLLRRLKKENELFLILFLPQSLSRLSVRISLLFFFLFFTDQGLHKIRHSSLACGCGFAFISSVKKPV